MNSGHIQVAGFVPFDIFATIGTVAVLGLICFRLLCRIRLTNDTIQLPFQFEKLRLAMLQRITLPECPTASSLILGFEGSDGYKQKEISLADLTDWQRKELLSKIESAAPHCKVSLKVRDLFNVDHRTESGGGFTARYDLANPTKNITDALKSRKRELTVCWCSIWALIYIPLLPLLYCTAVSRFLPLAVSDVTSLGNEQVASSAALRDILIPPVIREYCYAVTSWINAYVGNPFTAVSETARDSPYSLELIFIWCIIMLILAAAKLRHNRMRVSNAGIEVFTKVGGLSFFSRSVAWRDLESAKLIHSSRSGTKVSSEIQLVYGSKRKLQLNLKLRALAPADQRALIEALKTNATDCKIDSAILEQVSQPESHSYTELWLQSLSAPPKRERLAPLQPGQSLLSNRYFIKQQLASGGQGTAYIAEERGTTSSAGQIVLKEFVLPVYVDNDIRKQALEKFQHEAKTLQELNHPQIVRLQSYFIEDHRAYLVLEHVEGITLKKLVEEQGPLDEEAVRDLAKQMCDILGYLHGLNPPLIHRDFTPDNLILQPNGRLKLIDFDVARRNSSSKTAVVGKHAFIPPEQFRGRPSTKSDLYALGATLHFLLTAQEPEPLTTANPQACGAQITDDMNNIVERCTALDEASRYPSAGDLQDVLAPRTIAMPETEAAEQTVSL